MHWKRRVQRPCNHATVLARALARRLKLPVAPVLRRIRYGPSQTQLTSRAHRFENVRGHFAPRRKADLTGRTVCLVDNIVVSGATITEAAKAARRAGAKKIYAAVLARVTLPGDPLPAEHDVVPDSNL